MSSPTQLLGVIEALRTAQVNLADLLILLLQSPDLCNSPAVSQLSARAPEIFEAFLGHPMLGDKTLQWARAVVKARLINAVKDLSRKENGWHFSALRATPEKLSNFQLEEMANDMKETSAELWDLVGSMLGQEDTHNTPAAVVMDEEEAEYWAAVDDVNMLEEGGHAMDTGAPPSAAAKAQRRRIWRQSLIRIKQVVVVSIMMQSVNQQCNALQSIIGVFLHSCNTPGKVIKTLSRAGLSISHDSINRAVKSLSAESTKGLVELGQTLLASYAYDNFDVQLNVGTPTVEGGVSDNLIHLTSGDLLRLEHGVTADDLQCSEELWKNSPYNSDAETPPYPAHISLKSTEHLLGLHPEPEDPSGRTRRDRYNAWQFLYDLCHHGPEYFHQFQDKIGHPEDVEKIPVKKLYHVPARAMDINQSKVSGNREAIANLLSQGGVGDPSEDDGSGYQDDVKDMTKHVVLVHGDLSTYERVQSVMDRRSAEATPWRHFQYVVFVMGLFHLKMAAADALWRIFIAPTDAREDNNCIMAFVGILRPKEMGKIGSKPKFRQMHEVIRHTGIAMRLDAWRATLVKRNKKFTSLDKYAESKPSLEQLQEIALTMSVNYIPGVDLDIFIERCKGSGERDRQLENMTLLHQYMLLYEELTYAMNAGDIGRVETLFPPWIALFRATGKHKYATQMVQFLTDLHFRYPEGLRRAIRYNILVNPTGRPFSFRAVDWIVELNNLFTKVIYGGSGSNFTKQRILTESPLIQIYRNCHGNVEKNFRLGGLSFAHGGKDMRQTFKKLSAYMKDNRTNEYKAGRSSAYEIVDMLAKGLALEESAAKGEEQDDDFEWDKMDDQFLAELTAEDLSADAPLT